MAVPSMKWLGRAVPCGSWAEAETDLTDNQAYWNLCFKLGLFRRTLKALRPLQHCVGSSDPLPAIRGRDSRNLQFATHAPSAPAGQTPHEWRRERSWRLIVQQTGSAQLRRAAKGYRCGEQCLRPGHAVELPGMRPRLCLTLQTFCLRDFSSMRAATVPIRSRAL